MAFMSGESHKLLLIEDHADSAAFTAILLRRKGYAVEIAANCAEARERCRTGRFDLLLMDVGLPDGDGAELMRELAEKRGLRGIAISAHARQKDIERHLDAGFVAHLSKPIDPQALCDAVGDAIQNPV